MISEGAILKIFIRIAVIGFALLAVLALITSNTHTPAIKDANGNMIEGSIAEERFVMLGDARQYVLIRGRDRSAPLLVFLHGGPGTSAMAFNRNYNSALEDHFVFVNWDQRGTGYSFQPSATPSALTLAQITADLDELIEQLKAEFGDRKILLVGHSWGSMLGLSYISQHPEKVDAYVGIGQMAHTKASEIDVYDWAIKEAERRDDLKALETLQSIGRPPYDNVGEMMTHRSVVSKYGGSWVDPKSDIAYALDVMRASEFAWTGLRNILRGGDVSLQALFPEFANLNAFEAYPQLEVPIFFFEGRHDQVVSPKQAEAYLEAVDAPFKTLVWFEKSAHSPQWEEPEAFNREILRVARQVGIVE